MKQFVIFSLLCTLLTACDGTFRYHGHVSSDAGVALVECTEHLEYGDGKIAREPTPFFPPDIDGGGTIAPFDGEYTLVLACKEHAPYRARFKYGTNVTPSKALELGDIKLHYLRSAPNNSFNPTAGVGLVTNH